MEARELANKLYGRAYGDSFDDVLEEAKTERSRHCDGRIR